ncbi:MAG TPA: hypothetical protein VFR19_14215 [Hyphomicrobiaceae bacterium]|nr:hypothetical protein [Hyphomicrobiaceae bacterium]
MLIETATTPSHSHCAQPEFWSDVYSGRPIAILNHYGRLHVYLDHVLQHNVVFAEREDALAWLMQRIKQGWSPGADVVRPDGADPA